GHNTVHGYLKTHTHMDETSVWVK
ncbi:hypothetical protein LSAT2_028867, partial [Lamellibrachia satsuma]